MNPPLVALALLPAATAVLLAYALRLGAAALADGRLAIVRAAVGVRAITAAITGPYVWRVYTEFGNPLGLD